MRTLREILLIEGCLQDQEPQIKTEVSFWVETRAALLPQLLYQYHEASQSL